MSFLHGLLLILVGVHPETEGGAPVRQLTSGPALVQLIEQAEVPAETAGVLRRYKVRVGQTVAEDELLAELDAEDAVLQLERSRLELEAAVKAAESDARLRQAATALEESRSDLERVDAELEAARKRGASDLALQAARLAAPFADAELQRARAARRDIRDSVSQSEFEQLKLTADRAQLDVRQAELDRELAGILARAKGHEAASLRSAVARRQAEWELAQEDRELAGISRHLKHNGVQAGEREVRRRQIRSPLAGIVVATQRRPGEWVAAGDRVVRVVSLSRLRVETWFKAAEAVRFSEGAAADFVPGVQGAPAAPRRGQVTFISPEVDPVTGQVMVWAEFDNPGPPHLLKPGLRGVLTVKPADTAQRAEAGPESAPSK